LDTKIFEKAEDIPMAEERKVYTCGATWCSGKQGKEQHGS